MLYYNNKIILTWFQGTAKSTEQRNRIGLKYFNPWKRVPAQPSVFFYTPERDTWKDMLEVNVLSTS